jgi:hypothetical protein
MTLFGRIPESSNRVTIENVLRSVAEAHAGPWEIRIRRVPQTPWLLMRIKRSSDGSSRTLLVDAFEESLEVLAKDLTEAFEDDGSDGQARGH